MENRCATVLRGVIVRIGLISNWNDIIRVEKGNEQWLLMIDDHDQVISRKPSFVKLFANHTTVAVIITTAVLEANS